MATKIIKGDTPEIANRNQRRRQRTRDTILAAAELVFRRKGIDGTVVTDITEQADVAYGSFYNHFKSIDEIVGALVAASLQRVADRTGSILEAQTQYNAERTMAGATANGLTLVGNPLLAAILGEKYVVNFQTIEAWNDYKRTCYPNVTPNVAGVKIPARFLYDAGERQTNTSIPATQDQPTRNQNDPANAVSDGLGTTCLGQ